jgi:hypothetical protein
MWLNKLSLDTSVGPSPNNNRSIRPAPVRTRISTPTKYRNRNDIVPRARRDAQQSTERFQFDQATAKKSFKYVKVVTKYAFGVDIDAYIPLIVAGGSLLALVTFGLSGLFIVAASALGVILASSFVFLSLGWLFVPLVSFMVIGALAAGVGSFLLFPAIALGGVFALVSTLSSLAFARLDDQMIDDVIDSLDDDDRFDREELERFDARLRRRTGTNAPRR